jgi:hypothetical protein
LENAKYQCSLCAYTARDKYNMRLHLERRHQLGTGYYCPLCGEHCRTKAALSCHHIKAHKPTDPGAGPISYMDAP